MFLQVVKAFSLTEWPQTIDISPAGNLIAIGSKGKSTTPHFKFTITSCITITIETSFIFVGLVLS